MKHKKSAWDKKFERADRTIEALLLGFNKPIFREYKIPRASEITDFASKAVIKICGLKENCRIYLRPYIPLYYLSDTKKLGKNVIDGLVTALNSCRDEYSHLDYYMMFGSNILIGEWYYGYGDLFNFRRGERKKAEERVNKYWKKSELQDFKDISKIVRSLAKEEYQKKAAR